VTNEGNENASEGIQRAPVCVNVGTRRVGLPPVGIRRVGLPAPVRPEGTTSGVPHEIREAGQRDVEEESGRAEARRANENGIRKGRKWGAAYAQRCEADLEYIQSVFATYKVEEKMAISMVQVFAEELNNNQGVGSMLSLVDCTLKTLRGLKCSRAPGATTSIWTTEEGKIHSRFRRKLASNIVEDAHRADYKIILENGIVIEGSEKPRWLKNRHITFADIREVHNRKESAKSKRRRGLRDKPLSDRRVTEYSVEYLYKSLTTTLIASRRRSNECVFNMFGYLFIPWRLYAVRAGTELVYMNQSTMKFTFKTADSYAWHNTNVNELFPRERDNTRTYATLLSKSQRLCAGLTCVLDHELIVSKKDGSYERRMERRTINFFNAAVRLLVTLTFGKDETHILSGDSRAFGMVVGLAHGLYGLVRSVDSQIRTHGLAMLDDIEPIRYGPLSLSSLMPGPYRVAEIMRAGKVLRKKEGDSARVI